MKKKKPCIALIADEFTTYGLAPDADILPLTPFDWRWKLRLFKPDFLFVESAWRGYRNSWQGKIASYENKPDNNNELKKIVEYCKRKKIKTVFWNKEDPFHFERFSDSASFFDIIYTTDADSINRYDSLLDHRCQSVGVLMFAAQPHWYKPVPQVKRKYGVAFFGGYYGNQFSERSQMQYDVLHSLSRCGLVIYDRFWNKKNNCSYPNDLHVYCRPSIPLNLVAQAYTQYQIYLNFNTIRKSTTMLSRRVFELGASGCSIISSPSIAMNRIFEDSIISIANGQSAREWCLELQKDINKRTALGERAKEIVLSQHTWHHRLQQMNRDFELY